MTASGQGPDGTSTGGDAAKIPGPIAAGPEMKALGHFYRDFTWKGVIHEGGMGPGTPAVTGAGHGTARGHAAMYRGRIEGERLIVESLCA